jgi:hypothetical protein
MSRSGSDKTTTSAGNCAGCGQPAGADRGGVPMHPACARSILDTVARETDEYARWSTSRGRGR